MKSLYSHRQLIYQLVKRDVQSRYRGSIMGILWSFVTPLLLLAIYTFVFKYIFNARWQSSGNEQTVGFAMVLFMGLMIHGLISDVLSRTPALILENPNFVKKLVFPLEILPVVVVGSSFFHFLISQLVLITFLILESHALSFAALLYPVVILPYVLMLIGIGWMLSALGVYIRDIKYISSTLTTVMLFLSPVFFSPDVLPDSVRPLIYINPISYVVETSRATLILNQMPVWSYYLYYSLAAVIVYSLGWWIFSITRRGFADVI